MLNDNRRKRWRRYEISAIASAYLRLRSPAIPLSRQCPHDNLSARSSGVADAKEFGLRSAALINHDIIFIYHALHFVTFCS